MKKLNLAGNPSLLQLAGHVLFERIQDIFELHPGKLAPDIREVAAGRGQNPLELINELRELMPREFDWVLNIVACRINGQYLEDERSGKYSAEIRERFNLDPRKMQRDYPKAAKSIEMDVQEMISTIRRLLPQVISWTLDEVEKILKKEGTIK